MISMSAEIFDLLYDARLDTSVDWYEQANNASYGFSYINVAKTDPTKLSGMANNLNIEHWPTDEIREEKGTYIKPGKLLKALLKNMLVDADTISRYAAKLQRELAKNDPAGKELKVSDKPSEIYNLRHTGSGDTGCSCMRGMPEEYFEIFDSSPTTKMLYLKSGDVLLCRALLHEECELIDHGITVKMMDRIYTHNQNFESIFFNWAKENNYYRKRQQSSSGGERFVSPTGDKVQSKARIKLTKDEYKQLPYMDTFAFYKQGYLYNHSVPNWEDVLNSTEGFSEQNFLTRFQGWCINCSTKVYKADEGYVKSTGTRVVCGNCAENYEVCAHCEDIRVKTSMVTVEIGKEEYKFCNYCSTRAIKTCKCCGVIHMKTDMSIVGDDYVCKICYDKEAIVCDRHNASYLRGGTCRDCRRAEESMVRFKETVKEIEVSKSFVRATQEGLLKLTNDVCEITVAIEEEFHLLITVSSRDYNNIDRVYDFTRYNRGAVTNWVNRTVENFNTAAAARNAKVRAAQETLEENREKDTGLVVVSTPTTEGVWHVGQADPFEPYVSNATTTTRVLGAVLDEIEIVEASPSADFARFLGSLTVTS